MVIIGFLCGVEAREVGVVTTSFLLQSLLHDPNPNSPANNEAAQLYRENRREYEKKVAAIVQESWNEDSDEETEALCEGTSK